MVSYLGIIAILGLMINNTIIFIATYNSNLKEENSEISKVLSYKLTYFTAANILASISTQKKSLEISNERLKIIKIENVFGNRTNLDILNARVDYNKDSVNLMNLKHNYIIQKLILLELISKKWNTKDFNVQTHIKGFVIFQLILHMQNLI